MSVSDSSSVQCLRDLDSNVFVDSPVLTEKELQKQERDSERQMKKFIVDKEKSQKKQERLELAEEKKRLVEEKKQSKQVHVPVDVPEDENSIFDIKGTELHGKTKLQLLQKISQYKNIFKDELKTFKVKKNANEEELKLALVEMQTIVEIGSVDSFLMESFFKVVSVIEVSTSTTPYDISGMSVILHQNKEFCKLLKVVFCKYNTFSKIPPEIQLVLILGTTAMICINKNKSKHQLNQFLDEKLEK